MNSELKCRIPHQAAAAKLKPVPATAVQTACSMNSKNAPSNGSGGRHVAWAFLLLLFMLGVAFFLRC